MTAWGAGGISCGGWYDDAEIKDSILARKKISEYRAKTMLNAALGLPYAGVPIDTEADWHMQVQQLSKDKHYAVKVDEGVKGRFKKGLVLLDQTVAQIPAAIKDLQGKGFRYVLIEEYRPHDPAAENYLSIERRREGNLVTYSTQGGVDIESHQDSLKQEVITAEKVRKIDQALGLNEGLVAQLGKVFDENYLSFLEINPLIVENGTPLLLDAAAEVDGVAEPLVNGTWTQDDFRGAKAKTTEEIAVDELAGKSQASFSLQVLNPNGQVFLLLSGGGASVVLADEVNNQGFGKVLGNYGEYSGNPNAEEAYLYTREVVSLLLKSTAKPKVFVIGGGVANFTDIRVTFEGVIRALDESKDQLAAQHIKVFVRRGGPFEQEGLNQMHAFLDKAGLLGAVAGPDMPLSGIIPKALEVLGGELPALQTSGAQK